MKTTDTTSKRARRGAVLASGLACAALLLGGCAAEPREAADAAIVIQNTQNVPTWDDTVLDEAIAQVRSSGGRVTVTIADSNPTSQTFDFGEVADSALNQDRLERKLRDALRQGADDPGVDLLKSIEVGATSIAGSSNVVGVYVVSSGIADTGLLNMAGSNLVEADADAVAEYYAAKNELPDLSWVRVVTWYGMGATADGQAAPSTAQKASMEALYQAVLEKCGTGLSVQNASVARPEPRGGGLPAVGVVEFAPTEPYVAASGTDANAATEFSSTQLGFVGDGVEFVDPAQAAAALGGIAEIGRAHV